MSRAMISAIHPMMPEPSHDERAAQYFIRDFKMQLLEIGAIERTVAQRVAAATGDEGLALQDRMMADDVYRSWTSLRRLSQEMLWQRIADSVDRQLPALTARASIAEPKGSVTVDPDFTAPAYRAEVDVHLMPGGYVSDRGGDDIRQGAIMDRGGAVYLLGRNGGLMNDGRGHAAISHVFHRAPEFAPTRTLDMGCGVGASTVPVSRYFPHAEHVGIDVGGAILRYAHARAEHVGAAIHFVQADAEATGFPDAHFDLVYTCAVLHETSHEAVAKIVAEAHRILRPGGIMVHLEVPARQDDGDPWSYLSAAFESLYNNENWWHGATTIDHGALVEAAGFRDVMVGYQLSTPAAQRGNDGFSQVSSGAFACWFVVSGVK